MNEILGSGFRLYLRNFGVILCLVLSIGLPCQALSSYVAYQVFGINNFLSAMQARVVVELLFGIVISGGILQALFVGSMGRRASFLECLSVGISHWFQLCWTNFLMSCLVVMASVLFFIPIGLWQIRIIFLLPAIMLAIRLSLSVTVVITEGEWGAAALVRSMRLTADRSWHILGVGLFVYLPVQVAGIIGIGMLQTKPELNSWQVTAAAGTLLRLIACIIPVCFYCLYERIIAEDRTED